MVRTSLAVPYGVDIGTTMVAVNFTEALVAEVGKIRNGIPTGTLATQEEIGKLLANVSLAMCKIAIDQTLIPKIPERAAKEDPYTNLITEKCREEQLARAVAFFAGYEWKI